MSVPNPLCRGGCDKVPWQQPSRGFDRCMTRI